MKKTGRFNKMTVQKCGFHGIIANRHTDCTQNSSSITSNQLISINTIKTKDIYTYNLCTLIVLGWLNSPVRRLLADLGRGKVPVALG